MVVPVGERRGGSRTHSSEPRWPSTRSGARGQPPAWPWSRRACHVQMLDESVAVTWSSGDGLLEGEPESSEHALAMWMLSFTELAEGDVEGARASLQEARGSPVGWPAPAWR